MILMSEFRVFFLLADIEDGTMHMQQMDKQTKDLFVSFHCYCSRKEVNNN